MAENGKNGAGKYLYAIRLGKEKRRYGSLGIGAAEVYTIAVGEVAAVVSDMKQKKVRPERRNLVSHQQVLKCLAEEESVLPISFGTVAADEPAVQELLSEHRLSLLAQLQRVAGRVEMGLRVTLNAPDLFAYFVETYPELRTARDRLFNGGGEPALEQKIAIGQLFERLLGESGQTYATQVEEVLAPCCVEIHRNAPRDEREMMHLACLVEREAVSAFEKGVLAAAQLFDEHFAFDYSGPWPPHHFVAVDLEV